MFNAKSTAVRDAFPGGKVMSLPAHRPSVREQDFDDPWIADLYNSCRSIRKQLLNASEANWGGTPEWLRFRSLIFFLFGREGLERKFLEGNGRTFPDGDNITPPAIGKSPG